MTKNPTVFVSYSWDDEDHKTWVRELAARLRSDGVDVKLDQWEAVPGDQLPKFMETSIRENDFTLIICTPNYKRKSDAREGGTGYEGDIIAGEVLTGKNSSKFIPILRRGPWSTAAPSSILGKYYINLSAEPYNQKQYDDLLATLYGRNEKAPPLGPVPHRYISSSPSPSPPPPRPAEVPEQADIRIIGVVADEVSLPRMDGTPGSALYRIPIQLSRTPPREWARAFEQVWDNPPQFTSMHRPGIVRVIGDRIVLDGTTIEELQQVHRETLSIVLSRVNELWRAAQIRKRAEEEARRHFAEEHKRSVSEGAKKIKFE